MLVNRTCWGWMISWQKHDKRISRLSTQTSHHKNVLIFLLVQNLFPRGKESRDISLNVNAHYVSLFHSPIDKQQIKLFARRIFPENMDHFMAMYEKAAETPFGQLSIDLKPTTKDKDRLHVNLIKEDQEGATAQSEPDLLTDQFSKYISPDIPSTSETAASQQRSYDHSPTHEYTDSDTSSETSSTMTTACAEYGVLIDNLHDLQRHVKHWCPANNLQPKRKRARLESDDNDGDYDDLASSQKGSGLAVKYSRGTPTFTDMVADEWQNVGLQRIWKRVYNLHRDVMNLKRKKYKQQGRTAEWTEKRIKQLWENELADSLSCVVEYTPTLNRHLCLKAIWTVWEI